MSAATVESTLYTDANALGFTQKVAFGATILPFSITVATTSLDDAGDVVKLAPLVARGGRNRLIAVVWYSEALDSGGTLDADFTVYQDGAHTVIYNAGTAFAAAHGTAIAPSIIMPFTALSDLAADDSDGIADLCFYVNTGGGSSDAGLIKGFAIYE